MKRPDAPRPKIIGPDAGPEKPFPLRMGGKVVSGFGRGSKELGIPTANIPVDNYPWIDSATSGVYFGWASVQLPPSHPALSAAPTSTTLAEEPDPSTLSPTKLSPILFPTPASLLPPPAQSAAGWRVYPFVMSIGYNPFYKNTVRSAEVHVLSLFERDFYGCDMRVVVMGFVREEYDYDSLEGLVSDIREDCWVGGRSLARGGAWELGVLGMEGEREFLWGFGTDGEGKGEEKVAVEEA